MNRYEELFADHEPDVLDGDGNVSMTALLSRLLSVLGVVLLRPFR